MKKLLKINEITSIVLSVGTFLLLALTNEFFFVGVNLESLQTAIAPYGIIAIGMMALLISGVFDLSVGSVMCFGGLVTAICFNAGMSTPIAVICGIISGMGIGLLNGVLVEIAGINALITTIGTQYIVRGACELILMGKGKGSYTDFPETFLNLGRGQFLGMYYMVWIMIFLMIFFHFYLKHTASGRQLYFIGGNYRAASQMGIMARWVRIRTFILSGGLSALAGVLVTARSGFANRYTGEGIHMNIIIACIIGGGSLAGGQGSVAGAFFGMAFMALMSDAFNLYSIAPQWQSIIVGIILLVVVSVDGYFSLKKLKKLGKI